MIPFKKKLYIDRIFGTFAVIFVRSALKFKRLFIRRDRSIPPNPKVIIISKLMGFGSIVYTGIVCKAIKKRFPEATLAYVTSPASSELVKRMNCVDRILLINDRSIISLILSTMALLFKLWELRPELYFDMEVFSNWSAIVATLSLVPIRYGFYLKDAKFKEGLHTYSIFFNTRRHMSEIYSQMIKEIGQKPDTDLGGILVITESDRADCLNMLRHMKIPDLPIILVNVNASELLLERRWPSPSWVKYLEQIARDHPDFTFLLTGSNDESDYVSAIYNALSMESRKTVFNTAGKFGFGAFLALIERCFLTVTNDSGPLHLAVALGRPTVSIWGPVEPIHVAPLKGVHKMIYEPVYCSPCHYEDYLPCQGNNICVQNISVKTVIDSTNEIIGAIQKKKP